MLLDTSGLYAYLDADDQQHDAAVRLLHGASRRVVHPYVLAELVALGQVRGARREAVLALVADVLAAPDFEVVWPDERHFASALALLEQRLDKSYSLCDALSFIIMRQRGLTEALTTDRQFQQEQFVRLLGN